MTDIIEPVRIRLKSTDKRSKMTVPDANGFLLVASVDGFQFGDDIFNKFAFFFLSSRLVYAVTV